MNRLHRHPQMTPLLVVIEDIPFTVSRSTLFEAVPNADALADIAKPATASVSISIDIPMNAEAPAGFAPKSP